MIEDLTLLCVTPNQVDAKVGEDGEEEEGNDGCHRDDSKRELYIPLRAHLEVDSVSMMFISPHCRPSYEVRSSGLICSQLHPYPFRKRQGTKFKILLRFCIRKILVLVQAQDLLGFDGNGNPKPLEESQQADDGLELLSPLGNWRDLISRSIRSCKKILIKD